MRHFFALNLNLKRSLFLRTDIKCYPNRLQEGSVLIPQTASPHNYPTRLAVRQQKAVLALERSMQGAGTIVVCFDRSAFVGMNPGKDQVTGQRQVGVEAINPAPLVTHPCVAFRIQNPEGKVGRLSSQADTGIALPQNLLLPLTIDGDPGNMCGDFC